MIKNYDKLFLVMQMIGKLKKIWKNSFIFKLIKKHIDNKFRSKITNTEFTILCPNCIGGVIYNRLGQRFNSPTVNLSMTTSDFCSLLENLEYYLAQDVEITDPREDGVPRGRIKGNAACPDIILDFIHYKTFEDGRAKWNERKTRIKRDNTYVIAYDIDNMHAEKPEDAGYINDDDFAKFEAFPCNNKILLTRNPECKRAHSFYIEPHYNEPYPLVYLNSNVFGMQGYEGKFDFVSFLNSKKEK